MKHNEQNRSLNWGAIYALLFFGAGWILLVRGFTSGFAGWIWFGAISFGMAILALMTHFCVSPFHSLFTFFSPLALGFLTLTFYFYLVLAFNPDAAAFSAAYISCTSLLAFVLIVTLWPVIKRIRSKDRIRYHASNSPKLLILSSLLGWGLLMLAGMISGIGSLWNIFRDPLQMRIFMAAGGMSYYKVVCDFFVIMPVNIAALKRYSEDKHSRTFPLLLLSSFLYTLASGSRGATILLAVNIIIIRQLLGKPFKPILIAIGGTVIIPFVAIAGEYRSNPLLYGLNIRSILKIASDLGTDRVVQLFIARFDASYYFNLLIQARHSIKLLYGMSYLAWPLQAIPRFLWPGKPLLPNTELTYRLVTESGANATFDFSIFGESYLNFGVMGIIFSALLICIYIFYMQRRYEKMLESRDVSEVLYFVIMWTASVFVIVSGVVAVTTSVCLQLVQFYAAQRLFLRKGDDTES